MSCGSLTAAGLAIRATSWLRTGGATVVGDRRADDPAGVLANSPSDVTDRRLTTSGTVRLRDSRSTVPRGAEASRFAAGATCVHAVPRATATSATASIEDSCSQDRASVGRTALPEGRESHRAKSRSLLPAGAGLRGSRRKPNGRPEGTLTRCVPAGRQASGRNDRWAHLRRKGRAWTLLGHVELRGRVDPPGWQVIDEAHQRISPGGHVGRETRGRPGLDADSYHLFVERRQRGKRPILLELLSCLLEVRLEVLPSQL
jgi:hypothetical protein